MKAIVCGLVNDLVSHHDRSQSIMIGFCDIINRIHFCDNKDEIIDRFIINKILKPEALMNFKCSYENKELIVRQRMNKNSDSIYNSILIIVDLS